MNEIARDVGDRVAEAIDKHVKDGYRTTLAVAGAYMITIEQTTAEHPEVVLEVRVPRSLIDTA